MSVMSPEESLQGVLELSQLSKSRRTRLERKALGPGLLILMWTLRIYVFLALPLVGYVFFSSLKG